MGFHNFYLRIIGYALLIALTSLAFTWSLYQPYMVATSSGLAVMLVLETFALIRYNQKIKKDLQRFIDAVKNQDTSMAFPHPEKDPFMKTLHQGFNEIITDFSLVRKEKELEHHFFQNILQHIGIGVMAFQGQGKIKLLNHAFKNLFQVETLHHLSHLKKCHKDLPDLLQSISNGEESSLRVLVKDELKNIAIRVSDIRLEAEEVRIASFQDITREMNRQEVDAWQRLIRVLRHEIMNSISPIRIMSGNLLRRVSGEDEALLAGEANSKDLLDDLKQGLQTIRKRSAGLSDFVETYRHLTRIPEPRFTEIRVKNLFEQVARLLEKELNAKHIRVNLSVRPDSLIIPADEKMLEQVLINLVKNAGEAIDARTARSAGTANEDITTNEDSIANEGMTANKARKADEDMTANEDETASEGRITNEDSIANEDRIANADAKAMPNDAAMPNNTMRSENKAEDMAKAETINEADQTKDGGNKQNQQRFHGRIEMKAYQQGKHTVMSISDNGQGIAPDQLESIFVPFYTTRESGSGIGLSLSRQLIHLHNGTLHVHSNLGKGTEMKIIL